MKKTLLLIGTLLLTAGCAFAYSMPRWGMTSVDVYIPDNEYASLVKNEFDKWAEASGNRMRFRYASTRFASNNAPIKVKFEDKKAPYYLTRSKRNETTGYFTNMEQGFINSATLTIYTKDREGRPPIGRELSASIRTEVGYILGLDKIFSTCNEGQQRSAMCVSPNGDVFDITEKDKREITKKYDRSNDDIKERKRKN